MTVGLDPTSAMAVSSLQTLMLLFITFTCKGNQHRREDGLKTEIKKRARMNFAKASCNISTTNKEKSIQA